MRNARVPLLLLLVHLQACVRTAVFSSIGEIECELLAHNFTLEATDVYGWLREATEFRDDSQCTLIPNRARLI